MEPRVRSLPTRKQKASLCNGSEDVTIDSLSKMRVKLAVQTLSEKFEKEMKECDKEATEETRNYILACATFWNVFNAQHQKEQELARE